MHEAMNQIVKNEDAVKFLSVVDVPEGHKCVYFKDGNMLKPCLQAVIFSGPGRR